MNSILVQVVHLVHAEKLLVWESTPPPPLPSQSGFPAYMRDFTWTTWTTWTNWISIWKICVIVVHAISAARGPNLRWRGPRAEGWPPPQQFLCTPLVIGVTSPASNRFKSGISKRHGAVASAQTSTRRFAGGLRCVW